MIEFFIIGFFLTILQYNRYINTAFNAPKPSGTSCSPLPGMTNTSGIADAFKFNRYDLLTIPMYIVFFTLFYMMVVFYGINLFEFILQSVSKSESSQLYYLSRYMHSNQYYHKMMSTDNVSLYFLKILLILCLFSLVLIHIIILIRTGIYEDKKKTVKRDFIGFSITMGIAMIFVILFI